MAEQAKITFVQATCAGVPNKPSARVPLRTGQRVPIIVVYGADGKPLRADGCGYSIDGKCVTPERAIDTAPNCLYTPPKK